MGEYATTHTGAYVKIGTCEDMYYLRFDQRRLVSGGDATHWKSSNWDGARFRFPFPDEDATGPGQFNDCDKGLRVDGFNLDLLPGIEHSTVQFTARQGYVVSLPCPEANPDQSFGKSSYGTLKVHKNGFRGSVFLKQQRVIDGHLVPVMECACGAKFNIGTEYETFELLAVAIRSMADAEQRLGNGEMRETTYSRNLHVIADRVLAGYRLGEPEKAGV